MADVHNIEKLYEIVKEDFERIIRIDTGQVQRAATIFSFGGVILSIAFYLYVEGGLFFPLFVVSVSLLGASLVLSFFAIRSWTFKAPRLGILTKRYLDSAYSDVLRKFIAVFLFCSEWNKRIASHRTRMVDVGFCFVLVGLFFLALSAFFN